MRIRTSASALLLACAAVSAPVPATAQSQAPAASPRAAQLRDIATFFLSSRPLSDMMIGGIETSYRDRLETREDMRVLEAAYPGIRAAMLAAASRSVHASAPDMLARLQADVVAYWDARLSGPEAVAFAALANDPVIASITQSGVPMQRGDSAVSALTRVAAAAPGDAAFRRRMQMFGQTRAGRRLVPLIAAYQQSFAPRLNAATQGVIQAALAEAHRAANAHVRALDPDSPLPYREQ